MMRLQPWEADALQQRRRGWRRGRCSRRHRCAPLQTLRFKPRDRQQVKPSHRASHSAGERAAQRSAVLARAQSGRPGLGRKQRRRVKRARATYRSRVRPDGCLLRGAEAAPSWLSDSATRPPRPGFRPAHAALQRVSAPGRGAQGRPSTSAIRRGPANARRRGCAKRVRPATPPRERRDGRARCFVASIQPHGRVPCSTRTTTLQMLRGARTR